MPGFDFETFNDIVNAVPYIAYFHPVCTLNVKTDCDSTNEEIKKCFSPEIFVEKAHTCVTFIFDCRLAYWKSREKLFLLKNLVRLNYMSESRLLTNHQELIVIIIRKTYNQNEDF